MTAHPRTILLIGLGDLGARVLDILSRWDEPVRVVVGGRNREATLRRVNLTRFSALQIGYDPVFSVEAIDLNDVERTAESIRALAPDIVFNTSTLQSWRIITQLPADVFAKLDEAQYGPWLPMHLPLMHKLMRAVKASGITTLVINAAFPDAVNAVLGRVGLAPTAGIGNVANVIPALRISAAMQLDVPVARVDVRIVAQHYVSHAIPRFGHAGDAPMHLLVLADGKDATAAIDRRALLQAFTGPLKRVGGREGQLLTAASAARVLKAALFTTGDVVHAPGPSGLPGGYPVRFDGGRPELELPDGLTREQAVAINEAGQRADGIDAIDADGTVHFTSREMAIMNELLGYNCETMPLGEAEVRAAELRAKYAAFARHHGVTT